MLSFRLANVTSLAGTGPIQCSSQINLGSGKSIGSLDQLRLGLRMAKRGSLGGLCWIGNVKCCPSSFVLSRLVPDSVSNKSFDWLWCWWWYDEVSGIILIEWCDEWLEEEEATADTDPFEWLWRCWWLVLVLLVLMPLLMILPLPLLLFTLLLILILLVISFII